MGDCFLAGGRPQCGALLVGFGQAGVLSQDDAGKNHQAAAQVPHRVPPGGETPTLHPQACGGKTWAQPSAPPAISVQTWGS